MFTGIIESLAIVETVRPAGSGIEYWFSSALSDQLTIDQSVAHDGICLTVDQLQPGRHRVTAVLETIEKSTIGQWQPGKKVNLERCMQIGGRIDGHIVQGHVDGKALCIDKKDLNGSWLFRFRIPENHAALIVEKGSVSINGTSLTVFDVSVDEFSVAIIPYTYSHTNIHLVTPGNEVNIEFDMMGKYVLRIHQLARQ